MGCYDTVRVPCPKCGTRYKAQTKAGDCSLFEYGIINAPVKLLADLVGEKIQCGNCGEFFELELQVMARTVLIDREEA